MYNILGLSLNIQKSAPYLLLFTLGEMTNHDEVTKGRRRLVQFVPLFNESCAELLKAIHRPFI